jgi:hypothetical protein
MTYKPFVILVPLAILVVFALIYAVLSVPPGLTSEQFELLRPGMTQTEVDRILNGPPRNDLRHQAIIWLPQADGRRISARIAPGRPAFDLFAREDPTSVPQNVPRASELDFFPRETSKSGYQAIWVAKERLFAVYFGPDGRLQQKYSSTVAEGGPPSVMDWIASRPRMIVRSLGL